MQVLAAVAGGDAQADVLGVASRLARMGDGEIVLAGVFPWSPLAQRLDPDYERAARREAEDRLHAARTALGPARCSTRALPGTSVARLLHDLAREVAADVIVVGSSHRGLVGRTVVGDVAARVLDGAPCAVAVAPRGYGVRDDAMDRLAVAYDGGPEADTALAWAVGLATATDASLTVLQVAHEVLVPAAPGVGVLPDDSFTRAVRAEAQHSVDAAVRRAGHGTTGAVLHGDPVAELASASAEFDLMVAGSRGYGPIGALLAGSVSRALVRRASCPVVVLPRSVHTASAVRPTTNAGAGTS